MGQTLFLLFMHFIAIVRLSHKSWLQSSEEVGHGIRHEVISHVTTEQLLKVIE